MLKRDRDFIIRIISFAVLAILLLALPWIIGQPYIQHIMIMASVYIVLCVSLHLTVTTGVLSLAHAAFMAIGAYISAVLTLKLGVSFWLALPIGGLAAALVALLLGYATLHVRGLFFGILSFAFCEIVSVTIAHIPAVGGNEGLSGIPYPGAINIPGIRPLEFVGKIPFYYLILAIMLVTVVVVYRLERSRIGNVFAALQESPELARSLGVNIIRYQVTAFVIGSFFAGVAGAFYAHYAHFLSPSEFTVWKSIIIFLLMVIGGMRSVAGPIVGALFLTILPELARAAKVYESLIYALVVLTIVFFLPGGLISLHQHFAALLKRSIRMKNNGSS